MKGGRAQALVRERLRLAAIGIHTFLAYGIHDLGGCDCGDAKCQRPGKHPRYKGVDRGATIDPERIKEETDWPDANIGLHCGLSRLVVIDIDPRNGGLETIERLEREHGALTSDVVADTGGGGEHRFFRATEGVTYPSGLGPGVDVLSGNKYPIIAPSRHASGGVYRWRKDSDPISAGFLLLPLPPAFLPVTNEKLATIAAPELDETEANIARLRSALQSISADCSRADWRDTLFAIHSTGWSCAEELAREWSQTAVHRWCEVEFAAIWKSASASREGGRTIASIFYTAKRNGWTDPDAKAGAETLGDIDNGRRFAAANRGKLLYVRASREWREYRNGVWRLCQAGEEVAAAKAIAEANLREAGLRLSDAPSDASKAAYGQALKVHRSAQRVDAMLAMAKAEPGLSVADPTAFDCDPLLLGIEGGAIDLRTGKRIDASPVRMISKGVGVPYDPAARCPRWKRFLSDILANEEEVRFVQRLAGYTLTGLVDEEVFLLMYGMGANGKSAMANVLAGVFGDYAVTVGSELISVTKNESEAARQKVRLRGARLVLVNEVGQNSTFNDQRVKEIVSREAISGRYLFGEGFDFFPTHKLWIRGNHRPAILDSGDGMWRRVILLPFLRQFTGGEKVRDLDRQLLEEEGSGILNWLIAGALEWQREGLAIPPTVARETAQYRSDTDAVGDWLASDCEVRADARCAIGAIYLSYVEYNRRAGMTPKTQPAFVRMMGTRGFARKSSNGRSYLTGIDIACDL